jgi:hypothetical protein
VATGTATLTLLVLGGDGDPRVTVHGAVRVAAAEAVAALRAGGDGVDRAAVTVGEAAADALDESPALAEALSLFGSAGPGELLLSSTASGVLGSHRFAVQRRDDGAVSVDWRAARRPAPLPAFLQSGARLVGRTAELESATTLLDDVGGGRPRALLLRGEAGIGKTALAGAISLRARDQGVTVLAGRCVEEVQLAFQPVADALRPIVDTLEVDEITERVGAAAPFLATMYPKVGAVPQGTSPEEGRELLRRALHALLQSVVQDGPTLLLIDDVQWAPRPTVDFLAELRRAASGPLFVVATLREGEVSDDRIVDALGDATVLEIGPLSVPDTTALIALHNRSLAREPRAIDQIHASSAGNPFYVEELALHAGSGGGAAELPHSLREVVLRRVSMLGSEAPNLFTVAAILGGPFDAPTLAQITGEPDSAVAHTLERGQLASLVVRTPRGFDFKHALARDALYGSVTSARRRLVHARIAEALVGPRDLVAYHLAAAATPDTLDRVSAAALDAIKPSGPRWAADSRPLIERALEALGLDSRPRRDRAELLWELCQAEYDAAEFDKAWRSAERAALEARAVGDLGLLAVAVKDMGYTMPNDGPFDRFVALAEEALQIGADDDRVVAHVSHALASHLSWRGNDIGRAAQLADRGQRAAARLDDEAATAQALAIRAEVLSGTADLETRLRVTEQYVSAHERVFPSALGGGFAFYAGALLSAGRRDEFDAACNTAERLAAERPWWKNQDVAELLAGCRGVLDGDLLPTLVRISPQLSTFAEEGISPFVAQAALIWRETGRTADLVPMIEAIPREESTSRLVPALLLLAHAELGNTDKARELLDVVAKDDFAALYGSYATGVALCMAAEATWHLRDGERATTLARHLRPYGGQMIVIPPCTGAFGAADYFLGLLADAYGDHDAAVARLEAALTLCERVRAPLLSQRVKTALAS